MSMDIAFPRNEKNWFEKLPPDLEDSFELNFTMGTYFATYFTKTTLLRFKSKKLKENV